MKVSIITVSYNSQKTILDTFNSIRNQKINSIEYIVVDGNSKDSTIDLIKSNSDIISKSIIEPDEGIYDAMNKGIKNATGDIIGILNSDDVYFSNDTLELIHNVFTEHDCDIVYGNINYVSQDLKRIIRKWRSTSFKKGSFKRGWHPPHPAFFVKKSVYEICGLYDTKYGISADFDFMLRALEMNTFKVVFVDQVFTKMRIGGESNKSLRNILKGNIEILNSFKKNKISVSPFLYLTNRLLPKIFQFLK